MSNHQSKNKKIRKQVRAARESGRVMRRVVGGLSGAVLLAAGFLALSNHSAVTQTVKAQSAQSTPTASPSPTTPVPTLTTAQRIDRIRHYSRVNSLRQQLGLTTQDLAALGVTRQVAAQIIEAIKTHVTNDAATISAAEGVESAVKNQLAQAIRKINVGPRDDSVISSVPTLQTAVSAANDQKLQTHAVLITLINGLLNPQQQALWADARSNAWTGRQVPGTYRYAALTDDQVKQLDRVARIQGMPAMENQASTIAGGLAVTEAVTAQTNQQLTSAQVALGESDAMPQEQETATRPASN